MRFCKRGLGGNLLFKLCDRACLTVACGGDLEVLDVSPMFQTGAFGKLILAGVNEILLGIISDKGLLPNGERRTLFVLCKLFFRNALLIRSLVYSAPKDFALPRTKRSLSRGRKEINLCAFSPKSSPLTS